MDIGILGLGHMGSAIAGNLLRAGDRLTVWNRSREKAAPPVAAAATLARTPGDAAAGSAFVSAPVFGRPDMALTGKPGIAAAGVRPELAAWRKLFEAISQRACIVAGAPEAANLVELCGTSMSPSAIKAPTEAMVLAERGGVARAVLLKILTGTQFDAPLCRNRGEVLVEGRFRPPGFPAALTLKDIDLASHAAVSARVPMPLLGVLRGDLLTVIARDGVNVDCTAIAEAVVAGRIDTEPAAAPDGTAKGAEQATSLIESLPRRKTCVTLSPRS